MVEIVTSHYLVTFLTLWLLTESCSHLTKVAGTKRFLEQLR